jgi:hypothetical protein
VIDLFVDVGVAALLDDAARKRPSLWGPLARRNVMPSPMVIVDLPGEVIEDDETAIKRVMAQQ